jgi:hypothetical protein
MALNDHDQARIREYLLDKLSDDEREKIEERLMVEDALFEELEILKGELIEEYREGELTGRDRKSFEDGFLSSPDGRQRQLFAAAIDTLERHRQPQRVGFLERVSAFFRKPQWAIPIPSVGLAAVIIAALIWISISQQPTKFVAITLTSSAVTRSTEDVPYPTIPIPADASELRVSLTLPQPATPNTRYRIVLDNRRQLTSLQPSGQDANSVSVVIPARHVRPGLYALVIYEIRADGTEQQIPGSYKFITQ